MSNAAPDGWSNNQLGNLVDVRSSNVDKKSYEGDAPVKLCNYTDVYYKNRITNKIKFMEATAKDREIERFALEVDDVIITKDSETPDDIAVPAHVSEELLNVVCGYHLTLLRPHKDRSNGQFLAHLFQLPSVQHHFYILANGITRFGLTADAINNAPLLMPPLPEQQKIAAILSSVDDVIEKTQAQIDKLKDLKTGMMQELLTKGIGHTEFKDSPVGSIPVGWEVVPHSQLCNWVGVGIASSTTHAYSEKGVALLRNQNILSNGIRRTDVLYITQEFSEENASKKIRAGDVLTVRTGYPGVSAVVPNEFDGCHSFTTLISRPKAELLNSDYLSMLINSDYGRDFVTGGQAGGAQQNLNVAILKTFPIILPPMDEQKQIFNSVEVISTKIRLIEKKKKHIESTKKALMQDLLTGKVRVNVA